MVLYAGDTAHHHGNGDPDSSSCGTVTAPRLVQRQAPIVPDQKRALEGRSMLLG